MHIKTFILLFIFKLIITYSVSVSSSSVDLYSSVMSIPSKSEEDRKLAAKVALKNILVRSTGDEDILKNYPKLVSYIKKPLEYISSFSYFEDDSLSPFMRSFETDTEAFLNKSSLKIKFYFQTEEIKKILVDSDAPLWGSNRPVTIVWFIHEEGSKKSFHIHNDFEFLSSFYSYTKFRGLPVIEPIFDLSEISILNNENEWTDIYNDIYHSSQKYNADIIYIMRFSNRSDGEWIALSTLKFKDQYINEYHAGSNIVNFLKKDMDSLTGKLAKSFAVSNYNNISNNEYLIEVSNISNYKEFKMLMGSFFDISALNSIKIKKINKEVIYFSFPSNVPIKKLITIISLNKHLLKVDKNHNSNDNIQTNLSYKWIGQ